VTDRHIATLLPAGEWVEAGASPIETLSGLGFVVLTTDCPVCLGVYARVILVRGGTEWDEHSEWWLEELAWHLSHHVAEGYIFEQDPDTMVGGAWGVYPQDAEAWCRGFESRQLHENDRPYHVNAWRENLIDPTSPGVRRS
jgi:hypothetical protein